MHDGCLEFLGANVLDDDPFIVMPFLKNGNVRNYILNNPTCNRHKIVSVIANPTGKQFTPCAIILPCPALSHLTGLGAPALAEYCSR
jgi:hypothetical protein